MFNGLFTTANFFIDIFKDLTFLLDKFVYSLVQAAYGVFRFLANATILNDQIVQKFTLRIYVLLGIIMVFVLAFNLLNYIIDPDKINDKKVGASTFVKDVMIGLAIISLTPMLFTKLYSLQSKILDSGVLVNLVLGGQVSQDGGDVEDAVNNGGDTMVASIYTAFLYPADSDYTALDCAGDMGEHSGENPPTDFEEYCQAYKYAQEGAGINAFSRFIKNEKYNFTPLVTTIAGVVLLFFILSFCLNLAKRVGKMALIQLIAPIPVTLELLPNKKGLRKTWFDTLIKVYLESFFFLLVMYIIVFLISLVPGVVITIFDGAVGNGLSLMKLVATVILIYGLLAFGKEAPKMVFDLLGIKETGVIGDAAKRALAIGSWSGNTAASLAASVRDNVANTKGNVGQKILSGFGGFGSSLARNIWGAHNVHNPADARNLRNNTNRTVAQRRQARDNYVAAHGGTIRGAMKGHFADAGRTIRDVVTGKSSSTQAISEQVSAMNAANGYFNNVTKGFAAYEDVTRQLNEAKASSGYAQVYKEYKNSVNPDGSEADFIAWVEAGGGVAHMNGQTYDLRSVVNAYEQQTAVKEERIKNKEVDIINSALGMMQYIDSSPQISLSADAVTKRDALKALLDSKGNIVAGKEIGDVYKAMEELNKQLTKDIATETRKIQNQQILDATRNSGGGNSGGSSGGSGGGH